jgi:hypothetical protein
MWTQTAEGRQFIEDVSRQVVQQVDADEMEFFDDLAAEHYRDPNPLAEKNTELGAGFEALVAAVTPAAIAAVTAVTIHLVNEISSSFQEASGLFIRERIKRLFSQGKKTEKEEKASTEGKPQADNLDVEDTRSAAAMGEQAEGGAPLPDRHKEETGKAASGLEGGPSAEASRMADAGADSIPPAAEETLPPLTQEQLEFLKKVARREARRHGLDSETARNLANAMIAAFALV